MKIFETTVPPAAQRGINRKRGKTKKTKDEKRQERPSLEKPERITNSCMIGNCHDNEKNAPTQCWWLWISVSYTLSRLKG
jgi:hypothetical protein